MNIENLQASHKLVGIQMTLEYNLTLVSFVEMINGSFWKDFGDIFTVVVSETDFPTIGILLLPQSADGWTRFPEGNGTIAAFRFAVRVLGDYKIRLIRLYVSTPESKVPVPIDPDLDPYVLHVRPTWNRADLNADGKVDILDLSVFAKAFASRPGQHRWNTNVDIDGNQRIDIIDAVKISNNFGKHT